MGQNKKLYEFDEELSKIKWDILRLPEVERLAEMCL